jgi:hypothetical protein
VQKFLADQVAYPMAILLYARELPYMLPFYPYFELKLI